MGDQVISLNFLKVTSALMPLRLACSGGQLDECDQKIRAKNPAGTVDVLNDGESEMECPICLDYVDNPRATRCKPVAHIFCKECIEDCFRGESSIDCPSCRSTIKPNELLHVNQIKSAAAHDIKDDTESAVKEEKKAKKNVVIENLFFKSKFERLLQELKRIQETEPQSKSLVFTQFSSTLQWMKQELPKHGFQFRTLSGDMPMKQRAKALRDFQKDPPTTIFLLSMRSGAGEFFCCCCIYSFQYISCISIRFTFCSLLR